MVLLKGTELTGRLVVGVFRFCEGVGGEEDVTNVKDTVDKEQGEEQEGRDEGTDGGKRAGGSRRGSRRVAAVVELVKVVSVALSNFLFCLPVSPDFSIVLLNSRFPVLRRRLLRIPTCVHRNVFLRQRPKSTDRQNRYWSAHSHPLRPG